MPIVIMKQTVRLGVYSAASPYAVWDGNMKQALDWCGKKNHHPNNRLSWYEPVRVKEEKPNA